MRTVVLVHGAWHGAWCWAEVLAGLDERGVPTATVDLPGPDLHGDADHVKAVLDGLDHVVLVGHSYGGAVVTDAGAHPAVERLVYLTAFALDEGETLATTMDFSALEPSEDGTATLDPELAVPLFYGDCKPADVDRALSLLRPQPLAAMFQPVRAVAWRERPTTYVLCGADQAIPPALQQKLADRIPDVALVEWPTASHSPFLSMPAAVVDLLAGLAAT